MHSGEQTTRADWIMDLWVAHRTDDPRSFAESISRIEHEMEIRVPRYSLATSSDEIPLVSCPRIMAAFVRLADWQLSVQADDSHWWLAYALRLSASPVVWSFLTSSVSQESIDEVNELNFYRSLASRFSEIAWFKREYHRSLDRHPDARITLHALKDSEELSTVMQQMFPNGDGSRLHKKQRQAIQKDAAGRFADTPQSERRRVVGLVLTRYYLAMEYGVVCPVPCPVRVPTHELILNESEAVWREKLTSETAGLWTERLHRDFLGHRLDLFNQLRQEFRPRFPQSRADYDFQHSMHEERVWNRYLKSITAEYEELARAWLFYGHIPALSRSDFHEDTEVLIRQVEDTLLLLETARTVRSRQQTEPTDSILNYQINSMAALKEYFESGTQIPLHEWKRQHYPGDELMF